jgi:hypothetical protein
MAVFALVSLAFSGWMAVTLYTSLKAEKHSGWRDYGSTVWIACGSGCGVVLAIRTLMQLWSPF